MTGTTLGFLCLGFSLHLFWFKSQDSGSERIVVHSKSDFLTPSGENWADNVSFPFLLSHALPLRSYHKEVVHAVTWS